MDAPAISLARESAIPIIVFSLRSAGALIRVLRGDGPAYDDHRGGARNQGG